MSRAKASEIGVWLGVAATAGTAIASLGGLFTDVYAREHPSWAAQGVGQDTANLLVIVPALLWAAYAVRIGSVRGKLFWTGLLLYLVYSYLLYALFVHFQGWFLVYVATLGTAFYAAALSLATMNYEEVGLDFGIRPRRALGGYLIATGCTFGALWLLEIVPAALRGSTPASALELGFLVNPVHVLDLAFVLPSMLVAGFLNWRGHRLGLVLGVPLLTFSVAMGAAIVMMMDSMYVHGLPFARPPLVAMSAVVVVGAAMLARILTRPNRLSEPATTQAPAQ